MNILSLDIKEINDMVEKGLTLPNYLINSRELINKYLDVLNIEERRCCINKLMLNNYSLYEIINKKIFNIYDDIFNVGFENYIKRYEDLCKMDNKEDVVKRVCSHNFFQILIDRYFEDFSFNIITNMRNMLKFNEENNNEIISQERIKMYNLILNYEQFNFERQKFIYNNIPNNIKEFLYEDFRNCEDYAYSLINKNIIDVNTLRCEKINGIKVYYLDGEDFILPVHCILSSLKKEYITWQINSKVKTSSISLIGTECLGLYANQTSGIVGFKQLNTRDIMHMYHTDSYSHKEYSSDKINELFTPHDLLANTYDYNEILIAQNILNNKRLIPDYVICYDELDETYFKFSKNLGFIPIIVINTKVYKKSEKYYKQKLIDYDDKRYKKR